MSRGRIRIEIVGADLEMNEVKSIERGWLDDRHVFGCFYGRAGDVGAGARADVGHAFGDAAADWQKHLGVVEGLEQPESVAAADEDGLRAFNRKPWLRQIVYRAQFVSHCFEALAPQIAISIAIVKREGHEEHRLPLPQEIAYFTLGVIQIAAAIERRVADQEKGSITRIGFDHLFTSVSAAFIRPGR